MFIIIKSNDKDTNYKKYTRKYINEDENFLSALQKIEECFHKILLVLKNDKLIGLISNGDLEEVY